MLFIKILKWLVERFSVVTHIVGTGPPRYTRERPSDWTGDYAQYPSTVYLPDRDEGVNIITDVMILCTRLHCSTKSTREMGLDATEDNQFFSGRDFYESFISNFLRVLVNQENTVKRMILVADKSWYVPSEKLKCQAGRAKKSKTQGLRKYPSGCEIHDGGVYNIQMQEMYPIWSNNVMMTRYLRIRLFYYLLSCMSQDERLEPYWLVFDFAKEGPYEVRNGSTRCLPFLNNRIGEADIACFHWARMYDSEHSLVNCVDADYIIIGLLQAASAKKSLFLQCNSTYHINLCRFAKLLKDNKWTEKSFALASIMGGSDYVDKHCITPGVDCSVIYDTVHHFYDILNHNILCNITEFTRVVRIILNPNISPIPRYSELKTTTATKRTFTLTDNRRVASATVLCGRNIAEVFTSVRFNLTYWFTLDGTYASAPSASRTWLFSPQRIVYDLDADDPTASRKSRTENRSYVPECSVCASSEFKRTVLPVSTAPDDAVSFVVENDGHESIHHDE